NPKQAMVVKTSRLSSALKSLADFRDADLLGAAASDIQAVALGKGKDIALALKKDDRNRWVYTKPDDYGDANTSFDDTPSKPGEVVTPRSINTVLTELTSL